MKRRRPSKKQIAAAQINGAKGTGPRDTSKTRWGAFDHGLYAQLSIGQGTHLLDYPQYIQVLQTLLARLGPAARLPENFLICDDLATELWRKKRLLGFELQALSQPDALNAPALRNAVRYLSMRDRGFALALERYLAICPASPPRRRHRSAPSDPGSSPTGSAPAAPPPPMPNPVISPTQSPSQPEACETEPSSIEAAIT